MKASEDRLNHLAHLICDGLYHSDFVDYPDEEKALRGIKGALQEFFQVDEIIDEAVQKKIHSLKRGVSPGSPEWEILYKKYYEEEAIRRRY